MQAASFVKQSQIKRKQMISRREIIAGATLGAVLLSSSASACKAPAPKDRDGYTKAINSLFAAWWARDFEGFVEPFRDPERDEPLPDRGLFDSHFAERAVRFRGELLFNGASVVAQAITPQQPNREQGICGGYARSDLFLIKFYPGAETPVIESLQFLETDLLASDEWRKLPGAPDVKIEPYWKLIIERGK